MKPRACGSFCLLRSEAALKGYAAHLEEAHAAHAELFLFSEQDGLDVDRLHRLEGDEAWVLLLLTGSSSYLWFDQEHHPRNLELCSVLRQRFQRINFVICPTSNSARHAWLASNTSLQSILGSAFQGNESLWDRFDPGFVSNRGICRLIQERQQEETQRPPETRLGTSRWLSVFFAAGLIAGCAYVAYLWNDRNRLQQILNANEAKLEVLQRRLEAAEAPLWKQLQRWVEEKTGLRICSTYAAFQPDVRG